MMGYKDINLKPIKNDVIYDNSMIMEEFKFSKKRARIYTIRQYIIKGQVLYRSEDSMSRSFSNKDNKRSFHKWH